MNKRKRGQKWVSETHGATKGGKLTPEYHAWRNMKTRCFNPRRGSDTRDYKDRGITIAPEWLGPTGFAAFLAYVGKKPSPKHSIDRIDNDKGYEPGNVKWSTPKEQASNKRPRATDHMATIDGVTKPVGQWCRDRGLSWNMVHSRIWRGWTPERAITTPVGPAVNKEWWSKRKGRCGRGGYGRSIRTRRAQSA